MSNQGRSLDDLPLAAYSTGVVEDEAGRGGRRRTAAPEPAGCDRARHGRGARCEHGAGSCCRARRLEVSAAVPAATVPAQAVAAANAAPRWTRSCRRGRGIAVQRRVAGARDARGALPDIGADLGADLDAGVVAGVARHPGSLAAPGGWAASAPASETPAPPCATRACCSAA